MTLKATGLHKLIEFNDGRQIVELCLPAGAQKGRCKQISTEESVRRIPKEQ